MTMAKRSKRPKRPPVVTPAEQARRTRFIRGEHPTEETLETVVRQRTSELLAGDLLHESLQGKPDGYFLAVEDLEAYIGRAIIRALLPYVKRRLDEEKGPALDRQIAWITRAEDFIK